MIASLTGTLTFRQDPYIILSVGGVGYKVYASYSVLSALSSEKKEITVFTYLSVKENALELYGFSDVLDLSLFEQLIGVSGIGPKTAMGVFTIGSRENIVQAIMNEDTAFFSHVPRLGKKNAQKIILELRTALSQKEGVSANLLGNEDSDVMLALTSLGFAHEEIMHVMRLVREQNITETSEKIRVALKYLGKRP